MEQKVDILIVGQGLCGSWLSHECIRAGLRTLVIDVVNPLSPSRLSAGIINPITGRRHVEVWLADQLLNHALESYGRMGQAIGRTLIRSTALLDHFPSPQMRDSFTDRIKNGGNYLTIASTMPGDHPFHHPWGIGKIAPVLLVDLPGLLSGWRDELIRQQALLEETFDPDRLMIYSDSVRYKDIRAERIIFCDGTMGLSHRFFPGLPYAPNKGEVLILEIPGLSDRFIYKQGMMLAPLSDGTWWMGSSYQWSFDHPNPTADFRRSAEKALQEWLKIPYKVLDHRAGIRPATLERRPFVGLHATDQRVGILNGMGTKGCSLAPYFASHLVAHILSGAPIDPEASVSRFADPT